MGAMENRASISSTQTGARRCRDGHRWQAGRIRGCGQPMSISTTGPAIITCDWFPAVAREGFRFPRDQSFTEDLHGAGLNRIENVAMLHNTPVPAKIPAPRPIAIRSRMLPIRRSIISTPPRSTRSGLIRMLHPAGETFVPMALCVRATTANIPATPDFSAGHAGCGERALALIPPGPSSILASLPLVATGRHAGVARAAPTGIEPGCWAAPEPAHPGHPGQADKAAPDSPGWAPDRPVGAPCQCGWRELPQVAAGAGWHPAAGGRPGRTAAAAGGPAAPAPSAGPVAVAAANAETRSAGPQ